MKPAHRRQFLHFAAGVAVVPAISRIAWAQAYPTRPVRWFVGYAAGGGNDIAARLMGQWLAERLGQQFVIENRPGANSNIGTEASYARRRMATRFSWLVPLTQSTRHSTTISISILSATSLRLPAS